jgi:hypothetical protein
MYTITDKYTVVGGFYKRESCNIVGQINVFGSCGASGNTLYWILFLVYVGPWATHLTGHCCWFTWDLGQHTLLGIVVGLRRASGNTLYWILLLAYVGPLATHFIVVGLCEVSDNTLYWASLSVCYGSSVMGLK